MSDDLAAPLATALEPFISRITSLQAELQEAREIVAKFDNHARTGSWDNGLGPMFKERVAAFLSRTKP